MKSIYRTILFLTVFAMVSCSGNGLFSGYRREVFPVTRVTESATKTIQILNESGSNIQHIIGIAFYGDSNKDGHFQVTSVKVGAEKVGLKDIFVPPMGVLNVELAYSPLDVETTEASFNGWTTTSEDRGWVEETGETEDKSKSATLYMVKMIGVKDSDQDQNQNEDEDENENEDEDEGEDIEEYESAIHRSMLVVAYDEPAEGYSHVELVGGAIPGPNGEVTAVGMGGGGDGDCEASGDRACFRGTFAIDMPGLMSGGALEVPMSGPVPLTIAGGAAEINMDEFPPVLIVVKGNGPGEPLEGKPVDAISIVISGSEGTKATGSFDGRVLSLSETSFRIRVLLGEITQEEINPGLAAAVDFDLGGLEVTTDEPFDGSKIIFGVETTLSATPSGNDLFDSFLGGARVIVKFTGMLELP